MRNLCFSSTQGALAPRVPARGGWKAEVTYDGQVPRAIRKDYCAQSRGYTLAKTTWYVYDTSGFPPGANPFTSSWPSGPDFQAIKQCPDKKWRFIPFRRPENTPPGTTPNPKDPDTYPWPGGKVPKDRFCCTKKG